MITFFLPILKFETMKYLYDILQCQLLNKNPIIKQLLKYIKRNRKKT